MFNIKALAVLMKITAKLDFTDTINKLKNLDIFTEAKNPADAAKQLTKEKAAVIGTEVISSLLPQLDNVSKFLPELVAAYKNVSLEEAEQLDAFETLKEIFGDTGIRSFFKTALRKKVEQKH